MKRCIVGLHHPDQAKPSATGKDAPTVWFASMASLAAVLSDDKRWHRYTPDFVLRRADGKHLVVEIKKDTYSPDIAADTRYDGQVFNVTLSDVPERKQDLVLGRYELPAPPAGSTVAVKIIDMLGEELILPFKV